MFKWLGRNIGYILNPASLLYNPPGKRVKNLQDQAKKNLESYIAETGKPPPNGTILSFENFGNISGIDLGTDQNNPLAGQTGLNAFGNQSLTLNRETNTDDMQSVIDPRQLPAIVETSYKLNETETRETRRHAERPPVPATDYKREAIPSTTQTKQQQTTNNDILTGLNPALKTSTQPDNTIMVAIVALAGIFIISRR